MNYSKIIKDKLDFINALQEAANDAKKEFDELLVVFKKTKENYFKSYEVYTIEHKKVKDIAHEKEYDNIKELLISTREIFFNSHAIYMAEIKKQENILSEIKKACNQIIFISDEVEALLLLRDRENYNKKISTRCM